MTHQKRHVRHSKRGLPFVAGRRVKRVHFVDDMDKIVDDIVDYVASNITAHGVAPGYVDVDIEGEWEWVDDEKTVKREIRKILLKGMGMK